MNPSFSSTMGVQLYMCRLNGVVYDPKTETVDVGAGSVWDEVYGELARYRRNIVGGASASGVGVAGYLLGGGYSMKTNQYGLGIDNVTAIQVVLPNGEVHLVHEQHRPELFMALKVETCLVIISSVQPLTQQPLGRREQLRDRHSIHLEDTPSRENLGISLP